MINDTATTTCLPSRKFTGHLLILLSAALLMVFAAGCGGDDASDGTTGTAEGECQQDTDCDLGEVCSASNECRSESCDFCLEDQICYISADNPEGTCSASDCSDDADCGDEKDCVDGTCAESNSCSSDADCPGDEICSPAGTCIEDSGGSDECSTDTDCSPGEECDDGNCVDDGSGSGECDLDPGMCDGTTPYLDQEACQCVECEMTSHCDGDDVCQDGQCVDDGGGGGPDPGSCDTPCSQDQPGTCGGDTPYCIDDCCVECIGAADCSGAEICEDNSCMPPGGCSSDADCPSGYECDGGTCAAPDGGQSCDPEDPASCPDGQICNEQGQCEAVGGGDCGMCDPDCTCPGDSVCDGFMCTGCDPMGIIGGSPDCPDGQECLFGICMPM